MEVGVLDVVGVVVDHVEDDADADAVEGLHHLLELADTAKRIRGVGTVRALGDIIVHGIVAPVVLRLVQTRLVDGAEVVARQDMDGVDTQLLQVVDGPRLRQRQELTGMLRIGTGDGEVAVVHLVDDEVGRRSHRRTAVALPPFRVAVLHVDDDTFLAVHRHCLGKDARRGLTVNHELIGLALVVARGRDSPDAVGTERHRQAVGAQPH